MKLACVFAAVFAASTASPAAAVEHTLEHWHNINVIGRLQRVGDATPSPALYYLELQPRVSLSEPGPEELIARGALGWELSPRLIALAGAASIPAFDAPSWSIGETRFFQQLGYNQNLDRLNLAIRARVEERLFEARDPALRARAFLRAAWKLPVLDDQLSLLLWDEGFVNLSAENLGGVEAFDQNRFFAGVAYKFAPWFSVEIGYMNVVKGIPSDDAGQMRHVISLTTALNLL